MYSYTIQIEDALVEGVQSTFSSSADIDQWLQQEAVKSLQERISLSKKRASRMQQSLKVLSQVPSSKDTRDYKESYLSLLTEKYGE